jgi:hypothetical protein
VEGKGKGRVACTRKGGSEDYNLHSRYQRCLYCLLTERSKKHRGTDRLIFSWLSEEVARLCKEIIAHLQVHQGYINKKKLWMSPPGI